MNELIIHTASTSIDRSLTPSTTWIAPTFVKPKPSQPFISSLAGPAGDNLMQGHHLGSEVMNPSSPPSNAPVIAPVIVKPVTDSEGRDGYHSELEKEGLCYYRMK